MVAEYKIELPALRYAKRVMDLAREHDEPSYHHFLAMVDDIEDKFGAIAPDILGRMQEILEEQAGFIDQVDAYLRLKRAAGAPDKGKALPWLAERGLAKWDEGREKWSIRKLPLTGEQWIELSAPSLNLVRRKNHDR
jgi:hypothetical protein